MIKRIELKGENRQCILKMPQRGWKEETKKSFGKKAEEIAKGKKIEMKKIKIGYTKIQVEEETWYWNDRAEKWFQE